MSDQESIAKLRDLRGKSKRKVTSLIGKLTGNLQYGYENSSGLKVDLENEFDFLFDLNLQVEELEGESDYMVQISASYDKVIKLFHDSLKENEAIKKEKEAIILRRTIERNLSEISITIDRLNQNISEDPSLISKLTVLEIEEDKNALPVYLDKLLSDSAGLGILVNDMTDMEIKIDKTVGVANKIMRDANILLKLLVSFESTSVSKHFERASKVSNLSFNSPVFVPGKRDTISSASAQSLNSETFPHVLSDNSKPVAALPTPLPSSIIHTKKPSLPFFSGERADWPEFRCVWRSLAEAQYVNKMQLAIELKRCCKGKAAERIRYVYVTNDDAYDEIWARLYEEYDDPALSSQEAINRLMSLRPVDDNNFTGMVKLIDVVDGVHNQLKELGQLHAVHAVDVDRMNMNLPRSTQVEWLRIYRDLSPLDKMAPFSLFVSFLRRERASVARLADSPHKYKAKFKEPKPESHRSGSHVGQGVSVSKGCVMPKHGGGHLTESCNDFKGLTVKEKYNALKAGRRCFKCFGAHSRDKCTAPSCSCGKPHHKLLCTSQGADNKTEEDSTRVAQKQGFLVDSGAIALYPICPAYVKGFSKPLTVFMDGGSNASYVTTKCTQKYKLKRLDKVTLNVTTVGGENKEYLSAIYEVSLTTVESKVIKLSAYELPEITGKLSCLDKSVLSSLFPDHDPDLLVRNADTVDVLIGTDYFGLHPKNEVARAGANLSIMRGELGVCVVGTHPCLKESTVLRSAVPRTLHLSEHRAATHHVSLRGEHPAFSLSQSFIVGEELGTSCSPKCGGCKCGKCPLPGHTLSFREEQELHLIKSGLVYLEDQSCWASSYPWIKDPHSLPDNYMSALGTLKSTEKSLLRDPSWSDSYCGQIEDMVQRRVVRKLSTEEVADWNGPYFYVSHLAVSNAKSKSTPVRIVFNSAQIYKGVSLNSYLAKGPDSYRNTLLGILLRWKEEAVPLVGDIRKMFHSVHINPLEQHCHRFLWRDLDTSRDPDIYVILRVTMGDKPAPAIATEALFMTAEMHKEKYPRACQFILESSYVDDLIDSVKNMQCAEKLAKDTEEVLAKGGFFVKCWQSTGTSDTLQGGELKESADGCVGVLGVSWNPADDTISFVVTLNFSKKKHGERTEPKLERESLPESLPSILTKRLVLQQVMGIYDPMGLVSPFTLLAKVYLRETWQLKLDWDDALPPQLYKKWVQFFQSLFLLEDLKFPRCMRPQNAVGDPWLIILSDGSDRAYGCVAYARWNCSDGTVHMQLILSKSRIAPVDKVSTPRMELNGAVLSKRCRMVILREMRYNFERVIQLVDSETVLNMLHKTSYRFHVYEGVRIGEIQAATNGDMSEWAWMPGAKNTADWLTRGRSPEELGKDSDWFRGPPMFHQPFEQWDVRFGKTTDSLLPGEKKDVQTYQLDSSCTKGLLNFRNISTMQRAIRVVARLQGIAKEKSFRGGQVDRISPESLRCAETYLLIESQAPIDLAAKQYKSLNPAKNERGLWVVGASRLAHINPLGVRADLPVFIPKGHPLAELAMKDSHSRGHRGRDATLALFRNRFWTPSGPSLARKVTQQCQLCKLRNGQHVEQKMGGLPIDRAKPSPPFNHSMVDLFGPYLIRGEVQKRISGKAWGMIFTDLTARAVHIEAIFGYDTSQVLMALTRFVSVRGWPERIYSDPGSQLLSANKELTESANRLGVNHGLQWIHGPADSPWHQGAVEALVKTAKKAVKFAINDQRLSAPEFLTLCSEVSNTINERPIGLLPSLDSEINVLTPNCLLLGRATASNPGGWQPEGFSLKTRYQLVSSIGEQFWKHWLQLFAPSLVYQSKWHASKPDLQVGDVVLVADSNSLRGNYHLARVTKVHPSKDGKVRSVTLAYKNYKVGECVKEYRGAKDTLIVRSVQRLILLVPVEY